MAVHLERLGVKALAPRVCLRAIDRALREGRVRVAAADVDFGRWASVSGGAAARFAEVAPEDRHAGAVGGSIVEALAAAPPQERRRVLLDHLAALLSPILYAPAEEIDVDAGLDSLGVDSLMAVELANALRDALGVEIATMTLLRGPSLSEVADDVLTALKLDGAGDGRAAASPSSPAAPPTADGADPDLEELSDEELDVLLKSLL